MDEPQMELNAISTPIILPPHASAHKKKTIVAGNCAGCQKPSKAILMI